MTHADKILVTAPSTDLGNHFKILLVDFDWNSITEISDAIKRLPGRITLFVYSGTDQNPEWCLQQSRHVDAVLLNMMNFTESELIKGSLLPRSNCWYYGQHKLDKVFNNSVSDVFSWLAQQYDKYQKAEEKHEF